MYADRITDSMRFAIDETYRRRGLQDAHNTAHGIIPTGIKKEVRDITERVKQVAGDPRRVRAGQPHGRGGGSGHLSR